jgi:hypothetical protein
VQSVRKAKQFVAEAEITLNGRSDPAAVGASVSSELRGHWEHAERCRWRKTGRSTSGWPRLDSDEMRVKRSTMILPSAGGPRDLGAHR